MFQLLKLETLLNVATLGYSALWIEPHALIAGLPPVKLSISAGYLCALSLTRPKLSS